MIETRQQLYEQTKKTYQALLNRLAKRMDPSYRYTISDKVSFECTRLEDIFRPMWGIAPFLKNNDLEVEVDGVKMSAAQFINRIMIEGTAEDSPLRFDRYVIPATEARFANQSTTELAAYLVAVHFAREALWDVMDKDTRDAIAAWIKKWAVCAIRHSWQNNHYWYPIFCIEILKGLGYDCSEVDAEMQKGYDFLESLYYSHGWYSDGDVGRFDYYEAWAHHTYTLLWILIADKNRPDYEKKCRLYRERSAEYLNYFIHYFDADGGMAAYGRSIGYRFAAIAPFALAVMTGCDIDIGRARAVVMKNIDYFYRESIPTEDGCFPVGYLYATPGFGEGYASDGAISCYTEAFLCLLAGEDSPLWTTPPEKLPIEQANYMLQSPLEGLQTIIAGDAQKNGVTLYNNALHYFQGEVFRSRFGDVAGSYSKFAYNSRAGYGLSVPDVVSFDSMISLSTPDGQMASHRRRIEQNRIEDGVLISLHTPFSNDPETTIETRILPLTDGYHVRVHRVHLSRPYQVCEGGFTIGITDDHFKIDGNTFVYGQKISRITAVSPTPVKYAIEAVQPGMHLLAPQAMYPAYRTGVLTPGDYLFAATIFFTTDGTESPAPKISIDGNKVVVESTAGKKLL